MKMPPRNESQKDWHWRTAEEETSVQEGWAVELDAYALHWLMQGRNTACIIHAHHFQQLQTTQAGEAE